MTEMLTIDHDYDTPMRDHIMEESRKRKSKKNPETTRKTDFKQKKVWAKCFSGREEFNYQNI